MSISRLKIFHLFPIIVFHFIVLSFTQCHESVWDNHIGESKTSTQNLLTVIKAQPTLSIYYDMLMNTGYDKVLERGNGYTVLAPKNQAWEHIDLSNHDLVVEILGMTIIHQGYFTDNQRMYMDMKSISNKGIRYDSESDSFNGVHLIDPDISASNGVLHITDGIIERKLNIWEYIAPKLEFKQVQYLLSQNLKEMDMEKSVAVGVYPDGKVKYDTIWTNTNTFLSQYPIDNEDSTYTYVVVENSGFDLLYNKYKPFFRLPTGAQTDSLTRFNVCKDFIFSGIIDIHDVDTIINFDGVKVPLDASMIVETYEASNGRVYVLSQSNIKLKDKIKPIKIEGENYLSSSDNQYVFTRYKRWASGERDIVVASAESQADTLWRKVSPNPDIPPQRDSIVSKTYFVHSSVVANIANFYVEFAAEVHSTEYDLYYVAYDDIPDHFDHSYTSYGVYKVTQKMFISMPGNPKLVRGSTESSAEVMNNYLGRYSCFVGETYAGMHELTKLSKWSLEPVSQLIDKPLTTPDADVVSVPQAGQMTLWLCNTARSTTSGRQGILFLDYILLVPRISE